MARHWWLPTTNQLIAQLVDETKRAQDEYQRVQEEHQKDRTFANSRFADLARQITVLQTAATPSTATAMVPPLVKDKFYAVAKGYSLGIYTSLAAASLQTQGFSNALMQAFPDHASAQQYIDVHVALEEAIQQSRLEQAAEAVASGVQEKATAVSSKMILNSGPALEPAKMTRRDLAPAPQFFGSDPSANNPRKAFGVKVGTERSMNSNLSVEGMALEDQRDLAASTPDVVALLTGKTSSLGVEDSSSMAEAVVMTLTEMNARNKRNPAIQPDHNWQAPTRNSLKNIKTEEELQELYDTLCQYKEELLANTALVHQSIFENYYWSDKAIHNWSRSNLFFRIFCDSYTN
jgi:hypothetical protein